MSKKHISVLLSLAMVISLLLPGALTAAIPNLGDPDYVNDFEFYSEGSNAASSPQYEDGKVGIEKSVFDNEDGTFTITMEVYASKFTVNNVVYMPLEGEGIITVSDIIGAGFQYKDNSAVVPVGTNFNSSTDPVSWTLKQTDVIAGNAYEGLLKCSFDVILKAGWDIETLYKTNDAASATFDPEGFNSYYYSKTVIQEDAFLIIEANWNNGNGFKYITFTDLVLDFVLKVGDDAPRSEIVHAVDITPWTDPDSGTVFDKKNVGYVTVGGLRYDVDVFWNKGGGTDKEYKVVIKDLNDQGEYELGASTSYSVMPGNNGGSGGIPGTKTTTYVEYHKIEDREWDGESSSIKTRNNSTGEIIIYYEEIPKFTFTKELYDLDAEENISLGSNEFIFGLFIRQLENGPTYTDEEMDENGPEITFRVDIDSVTQTVYLDDFVNADVTFVLKEISGAADNDEGITLDTSEYEFEFVGGVLQDEQQGNSFTFVNTYRKPAFNLSKNSQILQQGQVELTDPLDLIEDDDWTADTKFLGKDGGYVAYQVIVDYVNQPESLLILSDEMDVNGFTWAADVVDWWTNVTIPDDIVIIDFADLIDWLENDYKIVGTGKVIVEYVVKIPRLGNTPGNTGSTTTTATYLNTAQARNSKDWNRVLVGYVELEKHVQDTETGNWVKAVFLPLSETVGDTIPVNYRIKVTNTYGAEFRLNLYDIFTPDDLTDYYNIRAFRRISSFTHHGHHGSPIRPVRISDSFSFIMPANDTVYIHYTVDIPVDEVAAFKNTAYVTPPGNNQDSNRTSNEGDAVVYIGNLESEKKVYLLNDLKHDNVGQIDEKLMISTTKLEDEEVDSLTFLYEVTVTNTYHEDSLKDMPVTDTLDINGLYPPGVAKVGVTIVKIVIIDDELSEVELDEEEIAEFLDILDDLADNGLHYINFSVPCASKVKISYEVKVSIADTSEYTWTDFDGAIVNTVLDNDTIIVFSDFYIEKKVRAAETDEWLDEVTLPVTGGKVEYAITIYNTQEAPADAYTGVGIQVTFGDVFSGPPESILDDLERTNIHVDGILQEIYDYELEEMRPKTWDEFIGEEDYPNVYTVLYHSHMVVEYDVTFSDNTGTSNLVYNNTFIVTEVTFDNDEMIEGNKYDSSATVTVLTDAVFNATITKMVRLVADGSEAAFVSEVGLDYTGGAVEYRVIITNTGNRSLTVYFSDDPYEENNRVYSVSDIATIYYTATIPANNTNSAVTHTNTAYISYNNTTKYDSATVVVDYRPSNWTPTNPTNPPGSSTTTTGNNNTPTQGTTPSGMTFTPPEIPLTPGNTLEQQPDGTFVEFTPEGTPLGRWTPEEPDVWVFDEYVPLANLTPLANTGGPAVFMTLPSFGMLMLGAGLALKKREEE